MNYIELSIINTFVLSVLTAIQQDEIFKLVSMVLTIVYSILSLILGIKKYTKNEKGVSKIELAQLFIKWGQDAFKDGKITKEELEELKKLIKDNFFYKNEEQLKEIMEEKEDVKSKKE